MAAYEPGRRFDLRIVEGPLPVDGDLIFGPTDSGRTRLSVRAHGQAKGAMRLLTPLLHVGLEREFRSQYARPKELLESQP